MANRTSNTTHERIYRVVRRIPRGRVATYGQVAALGSGSDVPWQRVINARGEVSPRAQPGFEDVQRQLLEAEGVAFDRRGRVDLARYRWTPRR